MSMQFKAALSLALLAAATCAQAAEFEETARVLSVTPQVEQFNQPREECHTEYVPAPPQRQSRGVGGSILGGLAGGLLGNQVGGGNGRTAATAVGAITGAVVGDRLENTDNNRGYGGDQPVRQCRVIDHWESRTNGYAVTYDYHGRSYTSVVPYDPGERIKLRVSLTPR